MVARKALSALLICAVLAWAGSAAAQAQSAPAAKPQPVGWVQEAKGSVQLVPPAGKPRPGKAKAQIFQNDTVTTGKGSRVQIIFTDKTMLALGENSELTVKEVMDLDGGGNFDLAFAKGVARVVTSQVVHANPDKFAMETPLGSVGIRGTEWGSLVDAGHEVHMLYKGGPVIYTDQQPLPPEMVQAMADLCVKLNTAEYKTQRVLDSLSSTSYKLNRDMKAQLKDIRQLKEQYRCQ